MLSLGKRTGEESRKKPPYQKWCRPFGPDIFRDTNSHSVTDIKTEIGISVVLAIVDAVVVEED